MRPPHEVLAEWWNRLCEWFSGFGEESRIKPKGQTPQITEDKLRSIIRDGMDDAKAIEDNAKPDDTEHTVDPDRSTFSTIRAFKYAVDDRDAGPMSVRDRFENHLMYDLHRDPSDFKIKSSSVHGWVLKGPRKRYKYDPRIHDEPQHVDPIDSIRDELDEARAEIKKSREEIRTNFNEAMNNL